MIEIHWLAVDEHEPHTPLEGRSRVLTVQGGAAWMEMTHDATFSFVVQIRLTFQEIFCKELRYFNTANAS